MPWPSIARRSAARARVAAGAPRAALLIALGVLALLGLRALVAEPAATAPAPAPQPPAASAAGHAEAFARAYLTWEESRHEEREDALAALGAPGLGAGLTPPLEGSQRVIWSAVLAERAGPGGTRVVTVAAETDAGELLHLAVPVARAPDGAPAIARAPALVGAPPSARGWRAADGPEVADPALERVARRALTNYLAGDRANLLADLAPGAIVSLPAARIRGPRLGALTWSDRAAGWAALSVSAGIPGGARADLAYPLSVVHEGRWLVRAIAPAT